MLRYFGGILRYVEVFWRILRYVGGIWGILVCFGCSRHVGFKVQSQGRSTLERFLEHL